MLKLSKYVYFGPIGMDLFCNFSINKKTIIMHKQQQLTQEQLNELKELAKTKTLKAIANHFNMNKVSFMLLRKEQPEIDAIYYEAKEQTKNKLYTAEEILAIEEMASTLNMENIARHLCISIPLLTRARNRQPELDAAIIVTGQL
jgi:hypothetical protein